MLELIGADLHGQGLLLRIEIQGIPGDHVFLSGLLLGRGDHVPDLALLYGPRRKRMTRQGRLSSAKTTGWVKQYGGKNIIKGYAKWFAVDPMCAVIELRMLGIDVSPEREAQIAASIKARAVEKQRKKKAAADAEFEDLYSDSDNTFAYIAGYTPGGLPYGVRWEELGEEPPWLYDEDWGNEESIEQCAAQRTGSGWSLPGDVLD